MQGTEFLLIIWAHFMMDFIFQSDKMSINKSKGIFWLSVHSVIYTAPFLGVSIWYGVVNGLAHWLIDFMTSRATSILWQKEERRWFFVIIGFDQAIHLTILILTYMVVR